MFATPLATRPKPIRNAGATIPIIPTKLVTNDFVPSSRLLNFSRIFVPNSMIGVTAFTKASPSGTSDTFRSSTAFWNLYIGEASTRLSSRSDSTASSAVVAFVSCRTRVAWLPSATTFWNSVDRRENWNLPNNCSMARARFSGSSVSRAFAKSTTRPFTFPALASTMPLMFTPKPARKSDAFLVGLIRDARPDLSALAPSDALMPPSFIAVRKKARSSTLPPSCLTTGPAFGIAMVRSSIDVTVWFSTALRKLIFPARSSEATPNAFVTEIVVSSACCCSTLPSTASFAALDTWASRSAPILPIAAASAARVMVSETATPYFVNSFASSLICPSILSVSPADVKVSPYTRLNLIDAFSTSMNALVATVANIVSGTVKPTINWRPAHWVFLPKFRSCVDPCFRSWFRI